MLPRRAGSSRGSPHRRTASEADRPAPIAETSLRIWRVLLLAGNRNAATRATVCDCAAECAATPVTLIAAVAAAAATMMRAAVTALLSNGWADKRYEDVQNAALTLLYLQAFIGLLGTVGPTYTGVIVADVGVALFGLVAVASGYQALGRTYAALLMLMLLLDSLWLALFAPHIWCPLRPPHLVPSPAHSPHLPTPSCSSLPAHLLVLSPSSISLPALVSVPAATGTTRSVHNTCTASHASSTHSAPYSLLHLPPPSLPLRHTLHARLIMLDMPSLTRLIMLDMPSLTRLIMLDMPSLSRLIMLDMPSLTRLIMLDMPSLTRLIMLDMPSLTRLIMLDMPSLTRLIMLDMPSITRLIMLDMPSLSRLMLDMPSLTRLIMLDMPSLTRLIMPDMPSLTRLPLLFLCQIPP
ncbi:unnamed protein product [Closterium sp. NIES-64]|nr:unnamed protein product [Closterium sp. NIES-64]